MSTATDTVHGRIGHARSRLTPTQVATGVAIVLALGFALLFVQEPLVHDAMHNFRHAAGVTCH
jgi:cobalt transporter subunit CbtB